MLDSHSRYVQNDSFTLGPTSFLKKVKKFQNSCMILREMAESPQLWSYNSPLLPNIGLNVSCNHENMSIPQSSLFLNHSGLQLLVLRPKEGTGRNCGRMLTNFSGCFSTFHVDKKSMKRIIVIWVVPNSRKGYIVGQTLNPK